MTGAIGGMNSSARPGLWDVARDPALGVAQCQGLDRRR
jgi:hypothetical protein